MKTDTNSCRSGFVPISCASENLFYAMKMAIDRAIIFLCCLLVISFTSSAKGKKKQRGEFIHPFSDEAYETMLSLVQGTFNVPVAERTREQKNAVVRFWRNRSRYHLGPQTTPTLYFDGRKVLKISSISNVVGKTFKEAKSAGCKKIRNRAAAGFAGLSERRILSVTNSELKYRIHNAKFTNKAVPRPVTAKHVQSQHQVDLMVLINDAVKHNGKVYKYVLSVMDIFSRFVWLRPLEKKTSSRVAMLLSSIYSEHGPPDRLQSDRGPEFLGKLKSLCKKWKIKMIKSRPYHPQSQGKVERSHRRLREKIKYDLIALGKKGVNWAKNLPDYNRVLNEESKEELGWKTPFQIYYGRRSNVLVKAPLNSEQSDDGHVVSSFPTQNDLNHHSRSIKRLRKRASVYSKRLNYRMMKRHKKLHKAVSYKPKERVLVRYRAGKGASSIGSRKRYVIQGTVIKKSTKSDMYKIRFITPDSSKKTDQWFSVENLTALSTQSQVSKRTRQSKRDNQRKLQEHRKKFAILLQPCDKFIDRDFGDVGLSLLYNPPGNGNCQFEALCFWLSHLGIFRSAETIREEVVQYLEDHPNNAEGIPLELFAAMPWSQYLREMLTDGTYGDQLTLRAAADLYNIQIVVFSTLGANATAVISPSFSNPIATIHLGHYAEQHGEHYICVNSDRLPESVIELERSDACENEPSRDIGLDCSCEKSAGTEKDPGVNSNVQLNLKFSEVSENEPSIIFVADEDVMTCNSVSHLDRLPNEILEKILFMVLSSSGFRWPNHICQVFRQLFNVNTRFRSICKRFILRLPRIHFPSGGDSGIVSVRKIIKHYGSFSGLAIEIRRVISHPKWANAWLKLRYCGNAWFIILSILWKKKK